MTMPEQTEFAQLISNPTIDMLHTQYVLDFYSLSEEHLHTIEILNHYDIPQQIQTYMQ
jgi:hypothetical protein